MAGKVITQARDELFWGATLKAFLEKEPGRIRGIAETFIAQSPDAFNLKFIPVTPQEFLLGKQYLNKGEELYPKLLPYFVEMNSGDFTEILLTGSIGSCKTTLAVWTTAYQLYCLSAYKDPHREFELDRSTELLFVFQSLTAQLAKNVDFDRFMATVEGCRYFREHYPFNVGKHKNITSQLIFPNRIVVRPISGESTGAIGQNVFGGLLDEVNYMQVVENSKKSTDQGEYNQAIELYNSLARRRKSRFMKQGRLPGTFCIISSKRYPGQFTDLKEKEAREDIQRTGKSTIYVYDKRTWDVLPEDRFSGKYFPVFIGDESRKPRILESRDDAPDVSLVVDVPEEYRNDFSRDMMNALREIAGISTLALYPFFQSREDIGEMFDEYESVLSDDVTDFVSPPLQIHPSRFWRPDLPRWVHVDLSVRRDATGVACACVPGFAAVGRSQDDYELMPTFHFDFILRVVAPKGGEILFYKIRALIYALREAGLNIRWVSCDSYQCVAADTRILTNRGFLKSNEVCVGDLVQSRIGPRAVTKKWSFGKRDCLRITTGDGTSIVVTEGHKLEAKKSKGAWSWVVARDLFPGDELHAWKQNSQVEVSKYQKLNSVPYYFNAIRYQQPLELTENFAEWLGIFYGDGNVYKDGICIHSALDEADDVLRIFTDVWKASPSQVRLKDRQCVRTSLSSRSLVRWLSVNGFSKGNDIPESIWRSPSKVQAAFIRGLFSTDGSVSRDDGAVSFSTKYKAWAEFIQIVLRSHWGIESCLTKVCRTVAGVSNGYPTDNEFQYVVSVRGAREKFYNFIGFCFNRKQDELKRHLNIKGRSLKTRIVLIEKIQAEVFDFEVDEDHSYLANGFVSHNSTDMMQILRQQGFTTGEQSMDKETLPYEVLKSACYDRRIKAPYHEGLEKELISLELGPKNNRPDKLMIDHPPNGCFTGDMRVALVDGTLPTFAELAQLSPDEIFYVYSIGEKGLRIVPARHARVTKICTELMEVTLDNYQVIRCTPDHLFMLLDRSFVPAEMLNIQHRLMPLYRSQSSKGGWLDYERVWCPIFNIRLLTHHLSFGEIPKGHIIHHLDENKQNNDPRNLKAMTRLEHLQHHGTKLWEGKKEKMKKGHLLYSNDIESQAQHSKLASSMWKNGRFASRTSKQQNHRILTVKKVIVSEPVYDLTVPETENFALSSGVFVHNSKDCSDAMAGVVYGLTMRRDTWTMHDVPVIRMPEVLRNQLKKKQMKDPEQVSQEVLVKAVEEAKEDGTWRP